MDADASRDWTDEVLSRYTLGPAAATDAPREALNRLSDPWAVLVVEGVSDQIAVEALASRCSANRLGATGRWLTSCTGSCVASPAATCATRSCSPRRSRTRASPETSPTRSGCFVRRS